MENQNGWDTYSKLVLQQLETMSNGIESLRTELQDVKGQLSSLKAKEDRVQDLKIWKDNLFWNWFQTYNLYYFCRRIEKS